MSPISLCAVTYHCSDYSSALLEHIVCDHGELEEPEQRCVTAGANASTSYQIMRDEMHNEDVCQHIEWQGEAVSLFPYLWCFSEDFKSMDTSNLAYQPV